MDRESLKQKLEEVIAVGPETMNKVHDGDDGLEMENDKIYPVAATRERQRRMWLFLYTATIIQFVLGVLVMILNIIFIYDGMNSKWYGQPDENMEVELDEEGNPIMKSGGLKVVSIGEGIIAGFFYILLAGIAMLVLGKGKGHNKMAMIGVNATLLLLSFTLVITNACQIGLIHQYAANYDEETTKWYGEEPRQTSVIAIELVGNFAVFIFATVALLVVPHTH